MFQAGKRTGGDRRIYNMVEELKQKVTEGVEAETSRC